MKKHLLLYMALALQACQSPTLTPCPASYCSSHGECSTLGTTPICACDAGYEGSVCSTCAAGFHRDGDSCMADTECAADTCVHGTCAAQSGVAACTCDAGYDGPRCADCYGPYRAVPVDPAAPNGAFTCELPQQCNLGSCAQGFVCDDSSGTVVCTCDGPDCAACSDTTCGANGTCDDSTNKTQCTCDTGYQGAACASCYPGFHAVAGTCVHDDRCEPHTCSGVGTCSASTGVVVCTCPTAYDGDGCEACATGHHRNSGGACVVDETCGPSACPAHSTCSVAGGVRACSCDDGYAGQTCSLCYPGFHADGGGACVLDELCSTGTPCGGGTCEDGTGIVVCTNCPAGYSGAHCEVNDDDCGSVCQTGQCIDLVSAHQCLCTDGTWGASCPTGPTISGVTPSSGPLSGGGSVTITGADFGGAPSLTIGGITAVIGVSSPTSLTATVPIGVGIGDQEVRLVGLNAQVAKSTYTYTPIVLDYTGANQTFTVPSGVSGLTVSLWGAGGGGGEATNVVGGAGGFTTGVVGVSGGQVLTIVVGQGGAQISGASLTAAGAGGGYSGVFFGAVSQGNARLIAGGGGGGGLASDATFGAAGGNGGGVFGGAGAVSGSTNFDARGLGGSDIAGGIGGCFMAMQCGQNGLALAGGGGGTSNLTITGATFGGGGGAGEGATAYAGGGGGGYFGGGGGANGAASGGGGGSGFVHASVVNGGTSRSATPGVPDGQARLGYSSFAGFGGRAQLGVTGGRNGLVVISW